MEVYVARQPILNQKLEAVAFELLYRNSNTELAVSLQDPDGATVDVLVHAMFNIGWERISDGKPCFVNFTQNLLLSRLPHRLPPHISWWNCWKTSSRRLPYWTLVTN